MFKLTKSSMADFSSTLTKYAKLNDKSTPELLNNKGYRIAAGAVINTHKADAVKIKKELGVEMADQIGKSGKVLKRKKLEAKSNSLAVLIVIKRLRAAGKIIPPTEELKRLAVKMVSGKIRSVGFIRSGWIASLRKLYKFAKGQRLSSSETGRQFGKQKGLAIPAKDGVASSCKIENHAAGEGKHNGALKKYGEPGLLEAFKAETADMKIYIERKFRENAKSIGIKTN